ncbi:MAG: transglutaminase-like domain-containing protein, partial [Pirellulales bacterium]|nr:transglutaminase-like domain-containing protein [Pirellulales bacterium]
STRIPTPMMTAGVHIKDIDRPDFFGTEVDGSYYMPGREKIPALTVIGVLSSKIMEDELLRPTAFAKRGGDQPQDELDPGGSLGCQHAAELARQWTAKADTPHDQLWTISNQLRREFTFDREVTHSGNDPLNQFLTARIGGDHLFATAAAVMAQELGFNARLVTGFYVPTGAFDFAAGHCEVMAEDVHTWVEVQLADGRWIELEPTPGYRQPFYEASTWLKLQRFAAAAWPHILFGILFLTVVYLSRIRWIDALLAAAWRFGRLAGDRTGLQLLMKILQIRARLVRQPRAPGHAQRDWLITLARDDAGLRASVRSCCDAADRMIFGDGKITAEWKQHADLLVSKITTRFLRRYQTHP